MLVFMLTAGFLLAVGYCYVLGMYFAKPWPYNSFLFFPADFAADFNHPMNEMALGPYEGAPYPPLAKVIFLFFALLPKHVNIGLLFCAFIGYYASKIWRYIATEGSPAKRATTLLACTALVYPVLFSLDRGNTECLVFMLLFYAAEQIYAGRRLGGQFGLAAAAGIKLFPVACFPLAFELGGWRGVGKTVLWLAGITTASVLLLGLVYGLSPLTVCQSMAHRMTGYNSGFAGGSAGLIYAHSLFGLIKIIMLCFNGILWQVKLDGPIFMLFIWPYFFAACLLFAAGCYYLLKVERALWRKLTMCIIMMNLLPYTSGDYKLLHFVIPLCFFINEPPGEFDFIYTALFALLLIPKNYILPHMVMLGIPVNPLLMIALAALLVRDGLRCRVIAK